MAKLKDGFYKQTASSVGSDLLVLLAGGGAKPISDFALADGTNATGIWSINISGKSATVNCTEATSDTNRPIVVTNKSNGLYYSAKATLNYSTGNITAPTFTGALKGNADTATTASKLSTVSKTAWGQTYWTSGGVPTSISGDMTGVGNITITSGGNVDRFITFDTASTRSWRIGYLGSGSGDANYLAFQSTKTLTAADGWHDMLKIGCETGNAILAGQLTAAKFVGPLNNTLTFAAGAFSAKTYNNSKAVTVNIPTHTSHLTNNSGFLTSRGYIGTTAVQASSAAQALTGITTATFSGAVTLSGITSSTAILKFSRSGASTWNYIVWPGDTSADCRLAFGYSNTSSACYYYMTNTSLNPVANNARSLGTSSARWSTVYGVNGNFSGSNAYPLVIDSSHAKENGLIIRMSGTDKAWVGYTSGTGAYLYTYAGPHKIGVSDSGVGFIDSNTILHSGNSSVADGGSTWGSKLTVKINGTTKTLTIPANPNTWRPITNDYDVTTPSDTTSLSQTGAKSLQRNVRSFKRFTGSNTNGGFDLNVLTDGMIYNYGSSGYWKNGPSGMSYGRVLNLKDGSGGSIAGQLAWDTNHNSTTDTTRNLWWRVSDDGTFTEAKWHRIAYSEEIPTVTNYYWANVKVSSTSSATTKPTFGNTTINGTLTMGNIIITKSGSSQQGIKFGTSYLNQISNQLLWQSPEAIRFGSTNWDWNAWAGLKYNHSSKIIYLGLADGTVFNANSGQSGGKLYLPGISDAYVGNGTYKILHLGNSSVSGGGSSGGSSITVNIGNNSKTLTIPTSLPANGGTSSYTNYLKIHDVRGTNHLPNSSTYPEKYITAWFNNTGTPDGSWWSGITVKGWTNDYSAWQLCSYSSTGTANNYNLYFRNGINSGWGSWKTILDSNNSSVSGGGSSWGSSITVKINGTSKTLTIPSNPNTHWTTRIYAGASGTAANAAATNPYLKVTDDNTYRNQVRFVGGGATTVSSDASGNITISSTNTTYDLGISDYTVKIKGTTKNFVRDWGHGASNMNAVAKGGRSSMGMANLSTPSGGTATAVNPNGQTSWHHFINIAYTDGGAGSNSWITQIANKAGTTDLWVRSRSGGTISDTANWTAGWTRILTGTNYSSVLDGRYYTESEADSRFVNYTGDTMTGALTIGQKVSTRKATWLKLVTPGHTGSPAWCVGVDDTTDNSYLYMKYNETDTGYFYVRHDGCTFAPHFYESSDQRLKENIKAILNKDNIPQIKEFDWKESGEHSYGLIAQELEEQGYSELVSTKDDGYKTVNYSAALSLIVGKLQVKIKELEKEIENLKNKN